MNKLFLTIIKPSALTYHDLLLRVFTGATMIYHGQGKWFNLDATAGFFAKFGIERPISWQYLPPWEKC